MSRLEGDGASAWRLRTPDSISNEGNTEPEVVERPTELVNWGSWVEPSPAGTTPKESVEESEEESEERARGRREEEGTAGEGEARDVEVEAAERMTEEGLEPLQDEACVEPDSGGPVHDRLAKGGHVTAAEVDRSETLSVASPPAMLDEHAGEGTEEDAGNSMDERAMDSVFDTASWLEPFSVLSSLCSKEVVSDDTWGWFTASDERRRSTVVVVGHTSLVSPLPELVVVLVKTVETDCIVADTAGAVVIVTEVADEDTDEAADSVHDDDDDGVSAVANTGEVVD